MGDDPPYLTVGTEVSAKYKGAFCEAKIRKVVRIVKCKVTFKSGLGGATLADEVVKGTLRAGANVEAKHPDKNQYLEATINRIQDCSQYTVVFDDGDITTLRRSALCLKSGRHFNESETLDQLPLTHPEHFSNPVVGGRRGVRRRVANNDADKDETSDEEDTPSQRGKKKYDHEVDLGKVVCVEASEKKKGKDNWFPALIVSPSAQETVKIRVKDEYLVRSFKDGRYYTVPKKEITEFVKEQHGKTESNSQVLKTAVEKVMSYLDRDELPPHWDRDSLFGNPGDGDDDDDDSDPEGAEEKQREKKDSFLAQLCKHMDERGTPINKTPQVCNKDLDLYRLYKIVTESGGYSKVTNGGQWKNITGKLGFGTMPSTPTINLVKQSYKKYLANYEDFTRKLGCTVHSSSSSLNKPRNSRSVYRGGSAAVSNKEKEAKKEEAELAKKEQQDEKDRKAAAAAAELELDSASGDSIDTKKSETSVEEPRRSRSRQESKTKKDISDDDKGTEKSVKVKKAKANKEKDKEKEREKEETCSIKTEPPSPAASQGSKKGRGGSRKRKEKEDEPPIKELVAEPVVEGISKDVKIQMGEKLSVYYPKGDHNVTYEAKVVDINEKTGSYLVHYTGWNNRYDEWIMRDRISENLSLRANYQAKAQGKGPAVQNHTPSEGNSDTSGSSKNNPGAATPKATKGSIKKGRTTPSVPLSSTGTRSKTGTIKRKRLSADFEEPIKKKRAVKKSDKDAVPSEGDSEPSDVEKKNAPKNKTPPVASGPPATVSSKGSKATKDKKGDDEEKQSKSSSKDKEKESQVQTPKSTPTSKGTSAAPTSDAADKEKQKQLIDLNQIRSEMKGLDKIVKTKPTAAASSTPSSSSPPTSQPQLSAASGQKLDIYEFEEDINEAPKLKMFSPRSPDKKDDVNSKQSDEICVGTDSTIDVTEVKTASLVDSNPKDKDSEVALIDAVPSKPAVSPKVEVPTLPISTTKSQPKIVLPAPAVIQSTPTPRPTTPVIISTASTVQKPIVTPPPLLASPAQTRAAVILAGQPNITGPRGSLQTEPKVKMAIPTITTPQQQRHRAPTIVPPPLVASTSFAARASVPSPHSTPQGAVSTAGGQHILGIPTLCPKPGILPMPSIRPISSLPGFSSTPTTTAVSQEQNTTTTSPSASVKEVKVLPFVARKQELFPHLIQQQKPPNVTTTAEEISPKIPVLTSTGISFQKDKGSITTVVSTLPLPHPAPGFHPLSPKPSVLRGTSLLTSAPPKKEKKKRVSTPKKTEGKVTTVALKRLKEPNVLAKLLPKKKAKTDKAKPSLIPKLALNSGPKNDSKKDTKVVSALSKINDTISSFMQKTPEVSTSGIVGVKPPQVYKQDDNIQSQQDKTSGISTAPKTKPFMSASTPVASPKMSEKRLSPIKTNFLKDILPVDKDQRASTSSGQKGTSFHNSNSKSKADAINNKVKNDAGNNKPKTDVINIKPKTDTTKSKTDPTNTNKSKTGPNNICKPKPDPINFNKSKPDPINIIKPKLDPINININNPKTDSINININKPKTDTVSMNKPKTVDPTNINKPKPDLTNINNPKSDLSNTNKSSSDSMNISKPKTDTLNSTSNKPKTADSINTNKPKIDPVNINKPKIDPIHSNKPKTDPININNKPQTDDIMNKPKADSININPKTDVIKVNSPNNPKTDVIKVNSPNNPKTDALKINSPNNPKTDALKINSPNNPKTDTIKVTSQNNPKTDVTRISNSNNPKTDVTKISNSNNPKTDLTNMNNTNNPKTDAVNTNNSKTDAINIKSKMEAANIKPKTETTTNIKSKGEIINPQIKVEEKPNQTPITVSVATTSTTQPLQIKTVKELPLPIFTPLRPSIAVPSSSPITVPKSSVVVIESLPKATRVSPPVPLTEAPNEIKVHASEPTSKPAEPKVEATQSNPGPVKPTPSLPQMSLKLLPEENPKKTEEKKEETTNRILDAVPEIKVEELRPLTPSFLTSKEVLGPELDDELMEPLLSKCEERMKEEESCSSLLCEEEIPGSPSVDEDEKPRFDFSNGILLAEKSSDKQVSKTVPSPPQPKPQTSTDSKAVALNHFNTEARVKLEVISSDKVSDLKEKGALGKRDSLSQLDESLLLLPAVEKIPLVRDFPSLPDNNTPPSTPESTTLSTETGGSPMDSGRISPSGEGGSTKSKESTDGDSGDGSKIYFSEGDSIRKSGKEPPQSPINKRSRDSRGRNLSPPLKRRRVSRRKSPEEVSRSFNYRGGRSSSSRKTPSSGEIQETVKALPLPPPINLGKPPVSAKFGYLIPDLDGVEDPEERIALVMQMISSVREKYVQIKTREQVRERRQKRRKRRERERAAAARMALRGQEAVKLAS